MKKLTFAQKLWLPLFVSVFLMCALTASDIHRYRTSMTEERQRDLRNVSDVAFSIIEQHARRALHGDVSVETARSDALAALATMRYGKDGYFVVTDLSQRMVMHPIKPELRGRSMSGYTDPNGLHLYAALAVAAGQGFGDFVSYTGPHPGSTVSVSKVSFARAYQPWGWIVTTASYVDDIEATFWNALLKDAIIQLLAVAILSWIVLRSARSINREIGGDPSYALAVFSKVEDGDLTGVIKTHAADTQSILHGVKTMRLSLARSMQQIVDVSEVVSSAAQEIRLETDRLCSRSESQATALQQTTASMQSITGMVAGTEKSSRQARDMCVSATELTNTGNLVMSQVVDVMHDMLSRSRTMTNIISAVEEIAFQTNILALNAAVEAGRAGEMGRGFAVVASEVRSLAQRSALAAKEIRSLVEASTGAAANAAGLVERGSAVIDKARAAVAHVAATLQDVSTSAATQSQALLQINAAVAQLDSVTQENMVLIQQSVMTAQTLADQASQLRSVTQTFKFDATPATVKLPRLV